jgi:bis(5'-nucleosyl)-tetraphosphatase (symmetrical)
MSSFVIGDVQGCYAELRSLLDTLGFDPLSDRLWFVGDLVNRGPASLEVLRYIRSLGARASVVLGNHDLHLLALSAGATRKRGDDTLDEVLLAPDRDELLDWLRTRPLMALEGQNVLVHAGLLPAWPVEVARSLAAEVESALRGPAWREALAALYGAKPDRWSDGLQGAERLRVIVNAMTRMRFCSAEGVMDLTAKGGPDNAPAGFMPWFEVPGRMNSSHRILFGHWSALGLYLGKTVTCLDTGCVWGGRLTALRLEDGVLFEVPPGGEASRPKRER